MGFDWSSLGTPGIWLLLLFLALVCAWVLLPLIAMAGNRRLERLIKAQQETNRLLQRHLTRQDDTSNLPSMRPSRHDLDGG